MKIMIGCDHGGYQLKSVLVPHLQQLGHEVQDIGVFSAESCDYPQYALTVARAVARGEVERGVLVCGSGVGMCIAANRTRGVRAVQPNEPYTAKMSRRHNNSNVLCLGGRLIGVDMAVEILNVWLHEPFEGGRHQRRVDQIDQLGCPAES